MVSPLLSRVWQHVKLSEVSLGTRPQNSLVIDEDVKKPTNQLNKSEDPQFLSERREFGIPTNRHSDSNLEVFFSNLYLRVTQCFHNTVKRPMDAK